jgi:hypothetical protein
MDGAWQKRGTWKAKLLMPATAIPLPSGNGRPAGCLGSCMEVRADAAM